MTEGTTYCAVAQLTGKDIACVRGDSLGQDNFFQSWTEARLSLINFFSPKQSYTVGHPRPDVKWTMIWRDEPEREDGRLRSSSTERGKGALPGLRM
jgi:hypothetical protein